MERKQPVSDRVRSRRDSNLPLERPLILPLDHGGRLVTEKVSVIYLYPQYCNMKTRQ